MNARSQAQLEVNQWMPTVADLDSVPWNTEAQDQTRLESESLQASRLRIAVSGRAPVSPLASLRLAP